MGLTGNDGEALLLIGMDVLGDDAAGHAAPVESDELTVVVFGDCGVLDPLTGGRVEEWAKGGHVRSPSLLRGREFSENRPGDQWRLGDKRR
jgi:hypothetical protein